MIFTKIISQLLIFVLSLNSLECAKILAVFPFTGPSQYMCVEQYLKTLAARGHAVTSVTAFPHKTPITNFREIILNITDIPHDEFMKTALKRIDGRKLTQMHDSWQYSALASMLTFTNKEFQQLLRSNAHFDLIIIEALFLESLYALGPYFKAPMIGVSTIGTDVVMDELVDNISPVAYVPDHRGANLDVMDFWQRLNNLYDSTVALLYHHLVIIPDHQHTYEKYFPNPTLRLSEVRKDFALLLLNQHHSISGPRPYAPNVIEVAGMQIQNKPNKLPTDMEAFINSSTNGVIYFSIGSNIKTVHINEERLSTIMDVFAALPVNVLWKYEKPNLPNKPKNVYINKWFPQADILAHPSVKLFITHGGINSYVETIHYAKPIVGIPICNDQHLNILRAREQGLGLMLNFNNFTGAELRSAILEVLNNPAYTKKAQEISKLYHDRQMNGLDTAIYWTEYVLRHKGAPHLRVRARQLNFFQRHSIDTMAVLFGIPLLLLVLFIVAGVYKSLKIVLYLKRSFDNNRNKRKIS